MKVIRMLSDNGMGSMQAYMTTLLWWSPLVIRPLWAEGLGF
jgi:hypothetical protein